MAGDAGDGGSKVLSNSPHTSASAWESLAKASGSSMGTAKAERPDRRHARIRKSYARKLATPDSGGASNFLNPVPDWKGTPAFFGSGVYLVA